MDLLKAIALLEELADTCNNLTTHFTEINKKFSDSTAEDKVAMAKFEGILVASRKDMSSIPEIIADATAMENLTTIFVRNNIVKITIIHEILKQLNTALKKTRDFLAGNSTATAEVIDANASAATIPTTEDTEMSLKIAIEALYVQVYFIHLKGEYEYKKSNDQSYNAIRSLLASILEKLETIVSKEAKNFTTKGIVTRTKNNTLTCNFSIHLFKETCDKPKENTVKYFEMTQKPDLQNLPADLQHEYDLISQRHNVMIELLTAKLSAVADSMSKQLDGNILSITFTHYMQLLEGTSNTQLALEEINAFHKKVVDFEAAKTEHKKQQLVLKAQEEAAKIAELQEQQRASRAQHRQEIKATHAAKKARADALRNEKAVVTAALLERAKQKYAENSKHEIQVIIKTNLLSPKQLKQLTDMLTGPAQSYSNTDFKTILDSLGVTYGHAVGSHQSVTINNCNAIVWFSHGTDDNAAPRDAIEIFLKALWKLQVLHIDGGFDAIRGEENNLHVVTEDELNQEAKDTAQLPMYTMATAQKSGSAAQNDNDVSIEPAASKKLPSPPPS